MIELILKKDAKDQVHVKIRENLDAEIPDVICDFSCSVLDALDIAAELRYVATSQANTTLTKEL